MFVFIVLLAVNRKQEECCFSGGSFRDIGFCPVFLLSSVSGDTFCRMQAGKTLNPIDFFFFEDKKKLSYYYIETHPLSRLLYVIM